MFFTFTQNNSGGSFIGPAHYVVVEAPSAHVANALVIAHGLYFNGCEEGYDCECCGDRWHSVDDSDGTKYPQVYGEGIGVALETALKMYGNWSDFNRIPQISVFYLDGTRKDYPEKI